MAHEKELQKRRLEDVIRMHRNLTPSINTKNYSEKIEKIINNLCTSASYLQSTAFGWS